MHLHTALALFILCCDSQGQSYELHSETRFATRIHLNSVKRTQQPRVAGADHLVTKHHQNVIGLELNDNGGTVVIDRNKLSLTATDVARLRQGSPVVLEKEFEIYLTSDAAERSRAILIVRSATGSDKSMLYLLELEIKPD